MIAELGHFALALALMVALAGGTLPMVGAVRGDEKLMRLGSSLSLLLFLLIGFSFAALTHAYIVSDFSLQVVAANSHTEKPLLYRVTGVWGNHEGSLLLWVLILSLFAAAVAARGRTLPLAFKARALAIQAWIAVGFLAFTLFTSNPFARLVPAPVEGRGLNPLLQDPGLAFHPPMLYLGYVGFSIAFSFAIAALIEGRVGPAWARWVRPWTLIAWSALTGGIALGSWWAYYELGWGGWWFWDPVENASLMPWLAGTALIHSLIAVEKRDALKGWTLLLAILTFSLSLLGTFIVRSGVLTSVHAFASDPARGVFILLFLGLVVGGALTLYAVRAHKLDAGGIFEPISREGALVLNNAILAILAGTVLIGTLYPIFVDALTGQKVTVGPPWFNRMTLLLMGPLILVGAIAPMVAWKRANLSPLIKRMIAVAAIAVVAVAAIAVMTERATVPTLIGIGLALWLFGGIKLDAWQRLKLAEGDWARSWARLKGIRRDVWGMWLAHAGLAILTLGVTVSTTYTIERIAAMAPGESVEVGGRTFTLAAIEPRVGPNYTALRARFDVSRGGGAVTSLYAERRTYPQPFMETTEAAIRPSVAGDLYAVIGEATGSGDWTARLYFKPLIDWIWAGALFMLTGGLLAASGRRVALPDRSPKRGRRRRVQDTIIIPGEPAE